MSTTDEIEVNLLYNTCKFENLEGEAAENYSFPGLLTFLEIMTNIFPAIERVRKKRNGKWLTLYKGITFKPLNTVGGNMPFSELVDFIPNTWIRGSITGHSITCSSESGCLSNGNPVMKIVTFHDNGNWDLTVFGRKVTLQNIHVREKYTLHKNSIKNVFTTVDHLKLCSGMLMNKTIKVSRFHILEDFQASMFDPKKRTIRSVTCTGIVPFSAQNETCKTCRKMTFVNSGKKDNNETQNKPENDQSIRIKHLLKHAKPELVDLFIEQSKNVSRDPRGRRWSKPFIGTCLQLYTRSPSCYQLLVSSDMLMLPSVSTLILYKSKLKQQPGYDMSTFEWMLQEATRRGISDDGMMGGLIFDEMSIQTDIQINKDGDVVELVGLTDLGQEGDLCSAIRRGTTDKVLGTHALQLLFLGITGFRFPFAHFITDNIQASELYGLFWKAIQYLWTFGFKVIYTCMDGAVANRSFMHICVGSNSYKQYNFLSLNPTLSQPIIFTMDVSHVLKKIRNNLMKSGHKSFHTRLLTLPDGNNIHWQMFIDVFNWDQKNSLQLHRKLTNEHIYPDSQQKMRNYLAEDVLNNEMLHLFKTYKNYLGQKGDCLNGSIDLLDKTSKIIEIFRDRRPVKALNDPRIATLKEISLWFITWEKHCYEVDGKNASKMLMSAQCHEDIQACIQGFVLLCESLLKISSSVHITPAFVNSDVIENVFNQQRSTYNGANTNPNALQYRRTINSILVGQNVISQKSNAAKSVAASVSFTAELKSVSTKKRKKTSTDPTKSDIKVLRI